MGETEGKQIYFSEAYTNKFGYNSIIVVHNAHRYRNDCGYIRTAEGG